MLANVVRGPRGFEQFANELDLAFEALFLVSYVTAFEWLFSLHVRTFFDQTSGNYSIHVTVLGYRHLTCTMVMPWQSGSQIGRATWL